MKGTILLSYDVEEFDMPMEYGGNIGLDEQLAISTKGLEKLLVLLNKYGVKCTFYCTAEYALHRKALIQKLNGEGFEIASHGYYHSSFKVEDLAASKKVLEHITGTKVFGYRMARMMPLDGKEVAKAGYLYNSSINPTWIPGRYNNLKKPRVIFKEGRLVQLPASVTPGLRFPLFWLSFHNLPLGLYLNFCGQALRKDGYANIYFHPWEFMDYKGVGGAKFPGYVIRNSGEAMLQRTEKLIRWALDKGYRFETTIKWLQLQSYLSA